jgi:hypothetical protein
MAETKTHSRQLPTISKTEFSKDQIAALSIFANETQDVEIHKVYKTPNSSPNETKESRTTPNIFRFTNHRLLTRDILKAFPQTYLSTDFRADLESIFSGTPNRKIAVKTLAYVMDDIYESTTISKPELQLDTNQGSGNNNTIIVDSEDNAAIHERIKTQVSALSEIIGIGKEVQSFVENLQKERQSFVKNLQDERQSNQHHI